MKISRSVYGYRSKARDATPLIMRIKEITATRVHYGYRRVHVLLRREGWKDNHKRVYRFYRELGLSLRHRRPKRNKAAYLRQPTDNAKVESFNGRFREECLNAQNLTITRQAAKSTLELAQSFAERHGLDLSDHGHRESSSRFKQIDSFGIAGHSQRLLVWASI